MQIHIQVGDVLEAAADVLISTANPWLNLSGGVNGAILSAAGPAIQHAPATNLLYHRRPPALTNTPACPKYHAAMMPQKTNKGKHAGERPRA